MFEKEAKKWVKENTETEYKASYGEFSIEPSAKKSFSAGAEFGYNKAKEEVEKLKELISDCLFYCDHIDPYYNECLSEDNIFERAEKLGIKYE